MSRRSSRLRRAAPVAVLMISCASSTVVTPPSASEPTIPVPAISVPAISVPAISVPVLKVSSTGCWLVPTISTGFAVEGGWIVTVAHATRGSTAIEVDGQPAELVAIDLRSDVAVLRSPVSESAREASLTDASVGDPVFVSIRRDDATNVLAGAVHRTPAINFDEPSDATMYRRQGLILAGITIRKGDSGAPVIAADGSVVGMMFAMSNERGFGYGVNSDEIGALLPDSPDAPSVDSLKC